jgi:hypothetical protein
MQKSVPIGQTMGARAAARAKMPDVDFLQTENRSFSQKLMIALLNVNPVPTRRPTGKPKWPTLKQSKKSHQPKTSLIPLCPYAVPCPTPRGAS